MLKQITGKGARRGCYRTERALTRRGRFGAVGGELQNSLYLLARDSEFFHQFIDAHILQVFKHG
jgi:hypothetical protein